MISPIPVQRSRLVLAESTVLQMVGAVFAHECADAEKLASYSDCPLYVWVVQKRHESGKETAENTVSETRFVYVGIRNPSSTSNRFKQHHVAMLLLDPKWDMWNKLVFFGRFYDVEPGPKQGVVRVGKLLRAEEQDRWANLAECYVIKHFRQAQAVGTLFNIHFNNDDPPPDDKRRVFMNMDWTEKSLEGARVRELCPRN